MNTHALIRREFRIDNLEDPLEAGIAIYHAVPPHLCCLELSYTDEYPDGFDVLLTAEECLRLAGLLTLTAADLMQLAASSSHQSTHGELHA